MPEIEQPRLTNKPLELVRPIDSIFPKNGKLQGTPLDRFSWPKPLTAMVGFALYLGEHGNDKVSRRDFFKFLGRSSAGAAAVATLAACSPDTGRLSDQQLRDLEYSVDTHAFINAVLRQSLPSSDASKWDKSPDQMRKARREWVDSEPLIITKGPDQDKKADYSNYIYKKLLPLMRDSKIPAFTEAAQLLIPENSYNVTLEFVPIEKNPVKGYILAGQADWKLINGELHHIIRLNLNEIQQSVISKSSWESNSSELDTALILYHEYLHSLLVQVVFDKWKSLHNVKSLTGLTGETLYLFKNLQDNLRLMFQEYYSYWEQSEVVNYFVDITKNSPKNLTGKSSPAWLELAKKEKQLRAGDYSKVVTKDQIESVFVSTPQTSVDYAHWWGIPWTIVVNDFLDSVSTK